MIGRLATLLVVAALLCGGFTDSFAAADEIQTTLIAAKQAHFTAMKEAREKVLAEFQKAEEKLDKSKRPTAEKVADLTKLQAEKTAFLETGALSKTPALNAANRKYRDEFRTARKKLETAYDNAAAEYDKQKDLESASRVLAEKKNVQFRLTLMEDPRWFYIQSAATNKTIGVAAGSLENGTRVLQWDSKTPDMVWQLIPVGDEWFEIRNKNSGKVMGVSGGAKDEGAGLLQWKSESLPDQQWRFEPVPGPEGLFMIRNRGSGKVISLEQHSSTNGVIAVQTQDVPNLRYQYWKLVPIP